MKTKAASSRIPFLKYLHTILKHLNFILKWELPSNMSFVWCGQRNDIIMQLHLFLEKKKNTVKNLRTGTDNLPHRASYKNCESLNLQSPLSDNQ